MSRAPEASYDEARARVLDLVTSMDRAPVIGISGHGAAGKSTLVARLMTDLGGTSEQVIGTDWFCALGAGPNPACPTSTTGPPFTTSYTASAQPTTPSDSPTPSGPTAVRAAPATCPCRR